MKNKLLILGLILLFVSCSSDDSNESSSNLVFTEKVIRVELESLVDNPGDYTDIEIELFFSSYTEPEVTTEIQADSTVIVGQEWETIDKSFHYSYPELEENLSFSTTVPVIGGLFSLFSFNSSNEPLYEAKIYLDDELIEERTVSEHDNIFYLMEPEYSIE